MTYGNVLPQGDRAPKSRVNTLNALTGGQWMWFTKTVLPTSYPHVLGHNKRKEHGANKPPQLMQALVEFFSKPGERILDPFMGVGGSLLGSSLAGREAVGIELVPRWIQLYQEVCGDESIIPQACLLGSCRDILPTLGAASFDCIVTDPPYGPELKRTMSSRTATRQNRKTDFNMVSTLPDDFASLASYPAFLEMMAEVFAQCYRVLKPGKYMVFFMRDNYLNGEYHFTTAELSERAKAVGFVPKGVIVWAPAGVRLRPYGYPNAYVPNIAHHSIVVLHKPRTGKRKA